MRQKLTLLSGGVVLAAAALVIPRPALAQAPAGLVERFPQDTLLYVGWPGADRMHETGRDTEFAKLMDEPEVASARKAWCERIWPDLKKRLFKETDSKELARGAVELLEAAWKYPTSLGFISVDMTPQGPQIDAALFIRAGKDAAALAESVNRLADGIAKSGPGQVTEVELAGAKLKEITPAGAPIKLRMGVIEGDVVIVIGEKIWQRMSTPGEPSLAKAERFMAAGKVVGASADTPMLFLDLKGVVQTLEKFQPLFATAQVPVLGQPGGVVSLLKSFGMENVQSFSMAMAPEAEGFRSKWFLHAPQGAAAATQPATTALTDADLKLVPRDVTWACVSRFDLQAVYSGIMRAVGTVSPQAHDQVVAALGMFEQMTGVKLEADIIGAFGDKWTFYDSPDSGGLLFTGITLIADVKPNNNLDAALQSLAAFAGKQMQGKQSVTLRREEYRGQKITYVDVAGLPIPVAPAWTQSDGKLIAALYPQMVRVALDQQMGKGPSLLDNAGFQNGRKHLPQKFTAISYGDTKSGARMAYSLVLPLTDTLIMMGQGEGVPVNPTFLPALPTLMRHLFAEVSASAEDEQGITGVSWGPVPASVGGASGGVAGTALAASVMLPSLARARALAKRSISMTNLKGIGVAALMYADQHDGQFPPDLQTLVKEGLVGPTTLKSPLDCLDAESSYVYVPGLSVKTPNPARTILAYEKPENYRGEGTTALFVDGHVEFMSQQVLEEKLGKPKARTELRKGGSASEKLTRASIDGNGPIATALNLYRMDMGFYPKELKQLTEKPEGDDAAKWKGPYLQDAGKLKDAWGNDLQYRFPGQFHGEQNFDLWSKGKDGQDGTEDDISNWPKP
jgi:type II secretion system protein G